MVCGGSACFAEVGVTFLGMVCTLGEVGERGV